MTQRVNSFYVMLFDKYLILIDLKPRQKIKLMAYGFS